MIRPAGSNPDQPGIPPQGLIAEAKRRNVASAITVDRRVRALFPASDTARSGSAMRYVRTPIATARRSSNCAPLRRLTSRGPPQTRWNTESLGRDPSCRRLAAKSSVVRRGRRLELPARKSDALGPEGDALMRTEQCSSTFHHRTLVAPATQHQRSTLRDGPQVVTARSEWRRPWNKPTGSACARVWPLREVQLPSLRRTRVAQRLFDMQDGRHPGPRSIGDATAPIDCAQGPVVATQARARLGRVDGAPIAPAGCGQVAALPTARSKGLLTLHASTRGCRTVGAAQSPACAACARRSECKAAVASSTTCHPP